MHYRTIVSYLYMRLISKLTLQKGCLLCGGCRYPQQRKRSFCCKQTRKKNGGERLHHYWFNHSILFSFRFTWHGPVMVKPLLFVCYLVAVECLLFLFFTLVSPPPLISFCIVEKRVWVSGWTQDPLLVLLFHSFVVVSDDDDPFSALAVPNLTASGRSI